VSPRTIRIGIGAIAAASAVLASLVATAQQRPLIPERRCTRVTLVATPIAGGRSVGLRVVNDDPGDFPARLRAEVQVEREVGGRWERVGTAGLRLRARCEDAASDCVTLERDTELVVVPWSGMLGDAQCECTRCAPAPAGRYRFVATTCQECQGPLVFASAPFTLPDAPR
jgi:hypothetical protein